MDSLGGATGTGGDSLLAGGGGSVVGVAKFGDAGAASVVRVLREAFYDTPLHDRLVAGDSPPPLFPSSPPPPSILLPPLLSPPFYHVSFLSFTY